MMLVNPNPPPTPKKPKEDCPFPWGIIIIDLVFWSWFFSQIIDVFRDKNWFTFIVLFVVLGYDTFRLYNSINLWIIERNGIDTKRDGVDEDWD